MMHSYGFEDVVRNLIKQTACRNGSRLFSAKLAEKPRILSIRPRAWIADLHGQTVQNARSE